eukprot:CAMPEP_0114590700 /NCGR_PEP_ID=MMETSP0125-20121206/12912_1 /TAXON_ID=485358 ORGANISM="Aristerostoma sp., Strain ATCC 50986" /NCGR_SAMPLE_ID=MMETSP0125 /ASSEMBLY_ACC=CAM_ASM_000245 /LENGTH=112 /DNA_ID=CAMNT_0001788377 /DNA_START=668 /DNA_END=1007 /DNA_ORIENTATION=+
MASALSSASFQELGADHPWLLLLGLLWVELIEWESSEVLKFLAILDKFKEKLVVGFGLVAEDLVDEVEGFTEIEKIIFVAAENVSAGKDLDELEEQSAGLWAEVFCKWSNVV